MSAKIAGYADRIAASPGDTVRFMVHSEEPLQLDADLVRVVHGDPRRSRGGPDLREVAAAFTGRYDVAPQTLESGSYAVATLGEPLSLQSWTLGVAVFPTRFDRPQSFLGVYGDGQSAVHLGVDTGGRLQVWWGGSPAPVLQSSGALPLRRWSLIGVAFDGQTRMLRLSIRSLPEGPADGRLAEDHEITAGGALLVDKAVFGARRAGPGAEPAFDQRFDGKIEAPFLLSHAVPMAAVVAFLKGEPPARDGIAAHWDFSEAISSRALIDRGPKGWHGQLHNLPSRGVRGLKWDGTHLDWRSAPDHYGAIHFHSDAQYDMGWSETFRWTIPADLPSGAYAARLRSGDDVAYVTIFVEPVALAPLNDTVFLAATATYLAYANETVHLRLPETLYGAKPTPRPEYELLLRRPEFGGSLYEHYADGSGVRYSSFLRPIVNMRPVTRMWSFNADTAILKWLEREAPGFDLITDHRLHAGGVGALAGARVVITGTHPEYYSDEMLDALEGFLARGGRLIYMGGNGFYWRTAFSSEWPSAIEVRRAEDGTRAWIEEAGEYHHSFDGRQGGLWRRNGRPPNRLVGVGFAAQGFAKSGHFRLTPAAGDPRAAFIFAGVGAEVLGDAPDAGAAGEEIDRFDVSLGSPAHALVVASSEGLGGDMLRVKEEFHSSAPHRPDSKIRADVTFFETPSGGAVFSTGSIAWAGAMACDDFDNDVARVTSNVLRRFRDPAPFDGPVEAAPAHSA